MTYQTLEQSMSGQRERLERIKGTEETVAFCTNPMFDRGTVYYCTINSGGVAVVKSASDWWGMSYAKDEGQAGKVLGRVIVQQVSGALSARLAIEPGYLREGTG